MSIDDKENEQEEEQEDKNLSFSNDSWIRHVEYSPLNKTMMVTTQKDNFECQGVPLEVYEEFKSAPSKGSYFNRNIKGKYNHEYFK